MILDRAASMTWKEGVEVETALFIYKHIVFNELVVYETDFTQYLVDI